MATRQSVVVRVNGTEYIDDVESRLLLVHYLRDVLGLTGTHIGCDTSQCGACTIIMDGKAIKSCTLFAVQADGRDLMTVEGLAQDGQLHPIQEGFWEEHGLQCGYCTPGMMMTAYDLLARNPNPSEEEIRHALHGNLCRCTGYQHIVNSVQYAARKASGRADVTPEPAPATTVEEVSRAAQLAGGGAQGGITPSDESWDRYYDRIREVYPSVTRETLERAKAHAQGQLEGIVDAVRERTGDAADTIRERLRGLLRRQ